MFGRLDFMQTSLVLVWVHYAPGRASVFWVSLPGIHMAFTSTSDMWDTHITAIHISL